MQIGVLNEAQREILASYGATFHNIGDNGYSEGWDLTDNSQVGDERTIRIVFFRQAVSKRVFVQTTKKARAEVYLIVAQVLAYDMKVPTPTEFIGNSGMVKR